MKDPMKSIPFLPKIVPGGGVGSCRGGVGHAGGGVGWGVSCRGGVGHVVV